MSRSWVGTVVAGLAGWLAALALSLAIALGSLALLLRWTRASTSLFQFFGYFGLFCATVLMLRLIEAILRDGLNQRP